MAIVFIVDRIDVAYQQCKTCGGVGYSIKTVRGQTYKTQCTAYGCQNGRIRKEHRTEVSLTDALKELGLIK